jgi:hypothetical protein
MQSTLPKSFYQSVDNFLSKPAPALHMFQNKSTLMTLPRLRVQRSALRNIAYKQGNPRGHRRSRVTRESMDGALLQAAFAHAGEMQQLDGEYHETTESESNSSPVPCQSGPDISARHHDGLHGGTRPKETINIPLTGRKGHVRSRCSSKTSSLARSVESCALLRQAGWSAPSAADTREPEFAPTTLDVPRLVENFEQGVTRALLCRQLQESEASMKNSQMILHCAAQEWHSLSNSS